MAVPSTLMILPRDMIMKHGNDVTVWKWFRKDGIQMCELIGAQWVFAYGALVKPQLQTATTYDVTFHVGQTKNHGDPIYTFEVELPDGQSLEQSLALPEGDYNVQLCFKTPASEAYEYVHVYIYNIDTHTTKKGLIIKGVSITPTCPELKA